MSHKIRNPDRVCQTHKLSGKQILAAELLASGADVKSISLSVSVCVRTISRWRQSEEFQNYVAELKAQTLQKTETKLFNLANVTLDVIHEGLISEDLSLYQRSMLAVKVLGSLQKNTQGTTFNINHTNTRIESGVKLREAFASIRAIKMESIDA